MNNAQEQAQADKKRCNYYLIYNYNILKNFNSEFVIE
jgi:hypothetical protein